MVKVHIVTDNLEIQVPEQYPLINLCEDHDTSILFGCRDGACGACMVEVSPSDAVSKMSDDEKDFLETMAARPNERLACQCKVLKDVTIKVSD